MGGMVAQLMAINSPDAIRSVITAAGTFGGQHAPQPAGGIDAMLK